MHISYTGYIYSITIRKANKRLVLCSSMLIYMIKRVNKSIKMKSLLSLSIWIAGAYKADIRHARIGFVRLNLWLLIQRVGVFYMGSKLAKCACSLLKCYAAEYPTFSKVSTIRG